MKKFLFSLLIILFGLNSYGQNYLINTYNGQTVNTCTGTFYDSGGASGNYGPNENFSVTFCSNNATNTHIKLYFQQFNINPSDTLYIYDGPNLTSPLIGKYNNNNTLFLFPVYATANNTSGCLTIKFKSGSTGSSLGWQADISCNIVCQTVLASIDTLLTIPKPDSNNVDICFGDTITFVGNAIFPQNGLIYSQSNATSSFQWNFGDGTFATGQVVKHYYNMVRGYNVDLKVADINGCPNMNSIGTRVRISKEPIGKVNSLPDICSGSVLNFGVGYTYNNAISVILPSYYQTASLKYDSMTFIPDGGALGGMCYNTFVTFTSFNPGQTVTAASDIVGVFVNMEHSFVGDLQMSLICPNGQSIILKDYIQQGGAYLGFPAGAPLDQSMDQLPGCVAPITDPLCNPPGQGYTYSFSMNPIYTGTMQSYAVGGNMPVPPTTYTGGEMDSASYMPFQSFSNLIGCPLNGTWNFKVCDYWAIDNGYIFWWRLDLDASILPQNWGYSVPIDSVIFTGPNIIKQDNNSIIIKPQTAGINYYSVVVRDVFGCEYDTTISLNVFQTPQPNLGSDITTCEGTPITLTAQNFPNATYYWLPNGETTPSVIANKSGDYRVIVQSGNGKVQCIGEDTVKVTYNPIPMISFISDKFKGCEPLIVKFNNVTNAAKYYWDFGDGTFDTINKSPTHTYTAGTYNVKLRAVSDKGCESEYIINNLITVYPQPIASFTANPILANLQNASITFINNTLNTTTYLWDFKDGTNSTLENPVHIYTNTGIYYVTLYAIESHGCSDTAYLEITIIDDVLEIPNVITPNGDGQNDYFVIKNLGSYLTNELIVYDRWGKKVYDKVGYQNDWDGENCSGGTYYFLLRCKGVINDFDYKGTLTIIK